jgi:glycosyltransferase involved in cell wall biosynthesis
MYSPAELKGMDITTQVLQRLRSRYPDIAIVSFGSHAMDARLPKDLQQSISYSVNPPQERIRNIYASCDLWLTTSRSEGFNLVAAEAMACRTPVIATHTGWPVEAITNGVNGYCCPIDDVEALYLACQNILNLDSSAWQKMSGAAHDATHGLSWTSSCTAFEEILTKVAQRS